MSLAELGRRIGLSKGTLHLVVGDLVAVRLLDQADHGYRLGAQLFELGMRASVDAVCSRSRSRSCRTSTNTPTRPFTSASARCRGRVRREDRRPRTGLHTFPDRRPDVVALHGDREGAPRVLLLARVEAGLTRLTPRTITAPGILRQQLDRVFKSGLAFEYEESAIGIVCVAAPVLDSSDRPIVAVSVTGPVARFKPDVHGTAVRAVAAGVAATLAQRKGSTEWTRLLADDPSACVSQRTDTVLGSKGCR